MVSIGSLSRSIFGTRNERQVRLYRPRVDAINELENQINALSDQELQGKTLEFRTLLSEGKSLDDILIPAFAVVREASQRVLGMRPFDVQLIGAMILHEGKIAEMRTGEGKTLAATLAVYLNALDGKGVHVVTVNDYLANRDAQWMGELYEFLGLTTGVIMHDMEDDARRDAYACDITYGTNNEFGFDYLRDNMKMEKSQMVQRSHIYAIVDEVDSILIDEARTPLIISGPLDDKSDLYERIDKFIPSIDSADYEIDEKQRTVTFTEEGNEKLESQLKEAGLLQGDSLYDVENVTVVHHINNALKAHKLFLRDKDYIVRDDEVVIIDEFTGRMMSGRRYSDGQHQALEAKEGVTIQPENRTYASITFQNYFRLYEKLSGMTGTALTEAAEFGDIYGLDVLEVPTNVSIARIDENDEVYRTAEEKYAAIIDLIRDCQTRGQPVLVGTTSIEKSEFLAERLKSAGIKNFNLLNARYHEQEAHIVGGAGVPGTITIATNMAGRGTDIQLGGNLEMRLASEVNDKDGKQSEAVRDKITAEVEQLKAEAIAAGGLYVLATERHESRRIDNQLRGRSGRQGDPGNSKFFLSLEDDLMRIFGTDRMDSMLTKLGLEEGEAITHPWINRALMKAQEKVEVRNFDIRKNLLKFDDVMNDQRQVIFQERLEMMETQDHHEYIAQMMEDVVDDLIYRTIPERGQTEDWLIDELQSGVQQYLNLDLPISEWTKEDGIDAEAMRTRILSAAVEGAEARRARFGPEVTSYVEKAILLQTLDQLWRSHLENLDHLRSVIGLRGYGQRDPLNEYKQEAFGLFESMLESLRQAVTSQMMRVELVQQAAQENIKAPKNLETSHDQAGQQASEYGGAMPISKRRKTPESRIPDVPASWGKVGRNEPCPCGSGKKFKHCCGKNA